MNTPTTQGSMPSQPSNSRHVGVAIFLIIIILLAITAVLLFIGSKGGLLDYGDDTSEGMLGAEITGFSGEVVTKNHTSIVVQTAAYPYENNIPPRGATMMWTVEKDDHTKIVIDNSSEAESEEFIVETPTTFPSIEEGDLVTFEVKGVFSDVMRSPNNIVVAEKIIIHR